MTPDSATTTTSTPAAQASPASPASAPGPQPAPAAPPTPAPVQLLWDVATLAFELMRRLVGVLQPVQARYPKQAWQLARLLIDIPRILLTIRYAPERVTTAQLRHLTSARHILQALFNYTLPGTPISRLASAPTSAKAPASSPNSPGARTPSSATLANTSSPSPNSPSATTPGAHTSSSSATSPLPIAPAVRETPAVAGVRQAPGIAPVREVPEIPLVAGLHPRKTPSAAPAQTQSPSPSNPQSVICNQQSAIPGNPQSSISPYIPDFHTLAQALKATSLPANCAGALFDEPGDALVKALHQLHAIYFSLYPNQSPTPPFWQSAIYNLQSAIISLSLTLFWQSAIYNLQSAIGRALRPSCP